jgi:hypothetical protein
MPGFALVILVWLLIACQAPSEARTLTAEVEHSEFGQPVEGNLQPGDIFDRSHLPGHAGKSMSDWYRIPTWLGGTWHKESQTDYFRYNYLDNTADTTARVQRASSDGVWGIQQDNSGKLWQFDPVPYTDMVDSGDETIVQIIRLVEPLESTGDRFVRRSMSTQLRVDKLTGKIKTVETGEQITVITPESNVLIKRQTSSKVFDHTGKPLLRGKSFAYETRTGPFTPRDFYRGQNMKELFSDFLKMFGATAMLPPLR